MTKLKTKTKLSPAIYFALVLASIGLVAILIINFLYIQVFIEKSEENILTLQTVQAKRISYIIQSLINHEIENLEGLTTHKIVESEEFTDTTGSTEECYCDAEKVIQNFIEDHPKTIFISVFDVSGKELKAASSENYEVDRGLSSSKAFYRAASKEIYISETIFQENGEAYIRIGIPIFDKEQKEMKGVLISGLNLDKICEIISEIRISATGRISIVDGKGNLIADVDHDRVLEKVNLMKLAPVRATMNGLIKNDEYLNEEGKLVVGVGVPIDELGWGVIIEQDSEEFRKIEKDSQFLISLFTGVGLILIIVIGWSILILINTDKAMRRYQFQLTKSEERFRDIVESSSDWIWETDKNGKYIFVSKEVKNILGYKPKELIGKTPFCLMTEEESKKIKKIFKELSSQGKPIKNLENWNITKNGKKICLLTNGVPVLDGKNRLVGYRGVDRNITIEKRTEEELKKKVRERTSQLDQRLKELEKWRKLTIGRELKMVELKKKIENIRLECNLLKGKRKK